MDAVQVTTGDETACAVVNDPFGEPIATNGNDVCASGSRAASTGNTYGYRGQSRDGSTGKYQMGARTYDPTTGAFTAPDAYRISDSQTDTSVGTDPLTANTYSYVNGNPLNLVDPSGHFAECLRGCSAETRKFLTKTVRDQVKNHSKRSLKDQEKDVDQQQADLNKQKRDAESKLAKGFEWGKALGKFLADVSGLTDIKRCIMDGDVKSCVMSVAGIVGASVFKLGKLYKGVRAAIRSYRAFDRARDAAQDTLRSVKAAEKALDATRKALAAERRAVKARRADDAAEAASDARRASGSATRSSTKSSGATKARKSGPEGEVCRLANSFSGKTLVKMADGSRKPISRVKVGDRVLAADPKTNRVAGKKVTHVWKHRDTLVDLKISGESITTTDDHPFWSETDQTFKHADQLVTGEKLRAASGALVDVQALESRSFRGGQAFNLTVADFHTYFVGRATALVHNCGTSTADRISNPLWSSKPSASAPQNALRHFKDHGADFPHVNNSMEYVVEAQSFLRTPSPGTLSLTRTNGDVVRYNPETEVFGIMNSSGAPKSFYIPDPAKHGHPTNLDYFYDQQY